MTYFVQLLTPMNRIVSETRIDGSDIDRAIMLAIRRYPDECWQVVERQQRGREVREAVKVIGYPNGKFTHTDENVQWAE